jgi:hypothetical protein
MSSRTACGSSSSSSSRPRGKPVRVGSKLQNDLFYKCVCCCRRDSRVLRRYLSAGLFIVQCTAMRHMDACRRAICTQLVSADVCCCCCMQLDTVVRRRRVHLRRSVDTREKNFRGPLQRVKSPNLLLSTIQRCFRRKVERQNISIPDYSENVDTPFISVGLVELADCARRRWSTSDG